MEAVINQLKLTVNLLNHIDPNYVEAHRNLTTAITDLEKISLKTRENATNILAQFDEPTVTRKKRNIDIDTLLEAECKKDPYPNRMTLEELSRRFDKILPHEVPHPIPQNPKYPSSVFGDLGLHC